MNVGDLRAMLDGLPDDATVDAEVTLGDGTRVVRACVDSVEHERNDALGMEWATVHLVTDIVKVAESEALASVAPEALVWVARNGEPLPGDWPENCD